MAATGTLGRPNGAGWRGQRAASLGLVALAVVTLAALAVVRAWVCEDAYITFRVLDNFVHGHGLRWNIDERVQVYSNPLWLLVHIPVYALTDNVFLTTLGLSWLCSGVAVFLVVRTFPAQPTALVAALFVPLILSKAFVEYATSGLETPMSFLLFAVFGRIFLRGTRREHDAFWLSLVASLALVNRLDALLLFAPPLAYLLLTSRPRPWVPLAVGSLPLVLWEAFSLIYYGFGVPNTKFAKLNTGIPTSEYVRQGLHYAGDLVLRDLTSACLLVLGLVCAGYFAWRAIRSEDRDRSGRLAAVGVGLVIQCLYVIRVGGDFMSGRFWVPSIFVAVWMVFAALSRALPAPRLIVFAILLGAVDLIGLAMPPPGVGTPTYGITDARSAIAKTNAFIDPKTGALRSDVAGHRWAQRGARHASDPESLRVIASSNWTGLGIFGFYAGPRVTIVDTLALADALLARTPAIERRDWRIAHFERAVPEGYLYARASGSTEAMDPRVAAYYGQLRKLTQGELWDLDRLGTIVAFQLGRYEGLRVLAGAARAPLDSW